MRRINKSRLKIIPFVVIPLSLFLIIFLVFKIGLFNIKKVEVESDKLGCADDSQIRDYSKLLGQNFFTTDQNKLTKDLKGKFICIKNMQLSKTFPDKVKIIATARQPVAILATLKEKLASAEVTPSAQEISDLSLIDDEGIIFSKETANLDIPKVFTFKDPNRNFLQILNKIKNLGINIKDSFIFDSSFIISADDPTQKIIFQLNDQIDIQLASLQLILDKAKIDSNKLEFIDLRFDKPIVRIAPKK